MHGRVCENKVLSSVTHRGQRERVGEAREDVGGHRGVERRLRARDARRDAARAQPAGAHEVREAVVPVARPRAQQAVRADAGVVAQEPFEKLCVNITDEKAPTLLPCEGVPPPSVWVRTTLVLARPFVI